MAVGGHRDQWPPHGGGAIARAFNPGVEEFSGAGTCVCSPRQLAVSSGCDGNDPQGTAGAADDFQWCGDDNGASWRELIKVGQTG
jgi:hypothetical protein